MLVAALLLAAAPTAEMLTVFAHPVEPGPRITPYLQYQLERAWRQDDRRRAAFEAVRSEADLLKLRSEIRARLLDVLGGLPQQRTPLNAASPARFPWTAIGSRSSSSRACPGCT